MNKQSAILQMKRMLKAAENNSAKMLEQKEFALAIKNVVNELEEMHSKLAEIKPINLPSERERKFGSAKARLAQSITNLLESIKI